MACTGGTSRIPGVRTRISDDMLFLPFVTAEYVRATGDADVLRETVPYLRNVEIPEGREDRYGEAEPSDVRESLHGHWHGARSAGRTRPASTVLR